MKAAILAGGAGTRLQPLTAFVPKSLIPIGNRYVIEYIIEYLKRSGIRDLVMLVSQNEADLIRNHLLDGKRFGVKVEYSVAERIGTAGAVGAASELLGETFLVYYGDVLTDMDLRGMTSFHEQKRSLCTLALSTAAPIEYGVGQVQADGKLSYFREKPVLTEYPVSIGIDIFQKDTLSYFHPNTDIAVDVIPRMLADGKPVYGYLTDKRHYDIGTFKSLEEVRAMSEKKMGPFAVSHSGGSEVLNG